MLALAFVTAALLLGPPQTPRRIQAAGDPIVGVGRVEGFQRILVDDDGRWFAQTTTDFPSSRRDEVVLREGFPALREEDPVADPAGATVDAFGPWDTDGAGNLLWRLRLRGDGLGGAEREGIYWNLRPLARPDTPAGRSAFVWQTWSGFGFLGPGTVLLAGQATSSEDGRTADLLEQVDLDPLGRVLDRRVLLATGDPLPVGGGVLRAVSGSPGALATHPAGTWAWVARLHGPPASDAAILAGLERVVAREGDPAPVPGRTYASFAATAPAVDAFGQVAFTAYLDALPSDRGAVASDGIWIAGGRAFAREGESWSALGGTLGDPIPTPLVLSDAGDLFWVARIRGIVESEDEAWLRNREVLLREGCSTVAGERVVALARGPDAFRVSPDGRFFVGRVQLATSGDALVRIDLGRAVPTFECGPTALVLARGESSTVVGGRLALVLSGTLPAAGTTALALARDRGVGCGVPTPFGALVALSPWAASWPGPPWTGTPTGLDLDLPAQPVWIDSRWILQAFGATGGAASLSNGLRLTLGAP